MAQLIVRDLDEDVVRRLKRRAAEQGHSAEEEHRRILRRALRDSDLGAHLALIPQAGTDEDFERRDQAPRAIDL